MSNLTFYFANVLSEKIGPNSSVEFGTHSSGFMTGTLNYTGLAE